MSPPQFERMRLSTKNKVKHVPTKQLLAVFDGDVVTFIGEEQALLSLLLFFCLHLHSKIYQFPIYPHYMMLYVLLHPDTKYMPKK